MNKTILIQKRGTFIGRSVDLHRRYSNFLFRFIFFVLWLVGVASIVVVVDFNFLHFMNDRVLAGWAHIVFALFLFYLADRNFFLGRAKYPELVSLAEAKKIIESGKSFNLYTLLSFESAKAVDNLFGKGVPTFANLLARVLASPEINFVLVRLGLSPDKIQNEVQNSQSDTTQIIIQALDIAILEGHHQIELGDIFVAMMSSPDLSKYLRQSKLEPQDIVNVVYWQTSLVRKMIYEKRHLEPGKLKMTGGIGRDWAFGWTPFLAQFSTDISRELRMNDLSLDIVGHDKEVNEIKEALLRQNGGNAIVVGEPGVGKQTTVLGFAKKVTTGTTYSFLDYYHVVKIDVDYLLAGLTSPGEITGRINGILNEISSAGNVIIYIENLQNLVSSGDAGKVDATEVLIPFLDNPDIHVVATCDIASFNKYIANNTALAQRFTRVSVEEPNEIEMVRILEDVVPSIEAKSRAVISYGAIKETIKAADKYMMNLPNPEKSINLLDSIAMHAKSARGLTLILPKDVDEFISEKFQVPAGDASEAEKQKLLNLETELHKRVIGQNEAINAISNALRRTRAGVESGKKPLGSFLFLGPTGVGKTETAKALAASYFGAEDRMLRFDMSEFQNKEDVYRLIGSNQGEANEGVLTTAIREHPFSLVLFDEIEKADKEILNLFLQILDEGILTDGQGRKVAFSNAIIIATSNAGSNIIRKSIQSGQAYETVKEQLVEYLQEADIYRPEFLNRFTAIIAFSPLSQEEIVKVAALLIESLKKLLMQNKGISVSVSLDAIMALAKMGYDPKMGARPMARVIQEKLENYLANKILKGELNKGDSITITARDVA